MNVLAARGALLYVPHSHYAAAVYGLGFIAAMVVSLWELHQERRNRGH